MFKPLGPSCDLNERNQAACDQTNMLFAMSPATAILIFALMMGISLAAHFVTMDMDRQRIVNHLKDQGGALLEKRWEPYGTRALSNRNGRVYQIKYRDRQGKVHQAYVWTSVSGGIFLTEDRVIEIP